MSALGLLNFLVLQWFGVRLARYQWIASPTFKAISHRRRGFRVIRWAWPLTGWWSDYRWIARRY